MRDYNWNKQLLKHIRRAFLERMHVIVDMISMFMFMEVLEPTFAVKKQV